MAAPIGNKFAQGITTNGRKPHFETAKELEEKCNEYFINCITIEERPTITGMTLFVGFSSRSSWDDYEERNKDFSYIVKRAKLTVEHAYEMSGTAFAIFALKNMGWKDKSEVDVNQKGSVNIANWLNENSSTSDS